MTQVAGTVQYLYQYFSFHPEPNYEELAHIYNDTEKKVRQYRTEFCMFGKIQLKDKTRDRKKKNTPAPKESNQRIKEEIKQDPPKKKSKKAKTKNRDEEVYLQESDSEAKGTQRQQRHNKRIKKAVEEKQLIEEQKTMAPQYCQQLGPQHFDILPNVYLLHQLKIEFPRKYLPTRVNECPECDIIYAVSINGVCCMNLVMWKQQLQQQFDSVLQQIQTNYTPTHLMMSKQFLGMLPQKYSSTVLTVPSKTVGKLAPILALDDYIHSKVNKYIKKVKSQIDTKEKVGMTFRVKIQQVIKRVKQGGFEFDQYWAGMSGFIQKKFEKFDS